MANHLCWFFDTITTIDFQFASGMKNTNFGFTLTSLCVNHVYSVLSLRPNISNVVIKSNKLFSLILVFIYFSLMLDAKFGLTLNNGMPLTKLFVFNC